MKVKVLLAAGMKAERVAREIGVTVPTLRKHYFHNGKVNARAAREMAISEGKARQIVRLEKAAAGGNVAAQKALFAIYDRLELSMIPTGRPAQDAAEPVGKKERLKRAAHKPEGSWATVLPTGHERTH